MNNLMALDYVNKDLSVESDLILPRWTQEYPKYAENFQSKDSEHKPWGLKSNPVFFDHSLDHHMLSDFEKGVWYFSSLKLSDHHELCGFYNYFYVPQMLMGTDSRYEFWINKYNRLRLLDFEETVPFEKTV